MLLEAGDFAGATSSAATKIIHGGVRYLEEAIKDVDPKEYHVVVRALHERVRMLDNAPHLTRKLEFLVPSFQSIGDEVRSLPQSCSQKRGGSPATEPSFKNRAAATTCGPEPGSEGGH